MFSSFEFSTKVRTWAEEGWRSSGVRKSWLKQRVRRIECTQQNLSKSLELIRSDSAFKLSDVLQVFDLWLMLSYDIRTGFNLHTPKDFLREEKTVRRVLRKNFDIISLILSQQVHNPSVWPQQLSSFSLPVFSLEEARTKVGESKMCLKVGGGHGGHRAR